jgi:hypothetical protein
MRSVSLLVLVTACAGSLPDHASDASNGDAPTTPWLTFFDQGSATQLATGPCAALAAQTDRPYRSFWQDDFTRAQRLPDPYFAVADQLRRINAEQEYYSPSGVELDSAGLHLQAKRVAPFVAADGVTYSYISGQVYTANEGSTAIPAYQSYGRWEVCASLPTAQGSWPGIWLLRNSPGAASGNALWPPEIDIMEHIGDLSEIQTNVWWGTGASPTSAEVRHPGVPADGVSGFHQYAVEYDASGIDYFVDGTLIRQYQVPENIPAVPMFLILGVAVGGMLPSYRPPCDAPTPGVDLTCADGVAAYDDGVEMVVKYARAYQP